MPPSATPPPAPDGRTIALYSLADLAIRLPHERLAKLRKVSNLTLDQVASLSGISRAELSRLETGDRRLLDTHLAKLSRAYNTTLNELKNLVEYTVESRVRLIQLGEASAAPAALHLLPLLTPAELQQAGYARKAVRQVQVPFTSLSAQAYALALTPAVAGDVFSPGTIIIADPALRVRLGEMVIDPAGQDLLLLRTYRNTSGQLAATFAGRSFALAPTQKLEDFHKIAAVLPAPELIDSTT